MQSARYVNAIKLLPLSGSPLPSRMLSTNNILRNGYQIRCQGQAYNRDKLRELYLKWRGLHKRLSRVRARSQKAIGTNADRSKK